MAVRIAEPRAKFHLSLQWSSRLFPQSRLLRIAVGDLSFCYMFLEASATNFPLTQLSPTLPLTHLDDKRATIKYPQSFHFPWFFTFKLRPLLLAGKLSLVSMTLNKFSLCRSKSLHNSQSLRPVGIVWSQYRDVFEPFSSFCFFASTFAMIVKGRNFEKCDKISRNAMKLPEMWEKLKNKKPFEKLLKSRFLSECFFVSSGN